MSLEVVLQILFLLVVGGVANMTPVLVKRWNIFNRPLDAGVKFRGKRLLGDGKTVRGFVMGSLASGFAVGFYFFFNLLLFGYTQSDGQKVNDAYSAFQLAIIGFSFGCYLGALTLLGDLIKSFFKRQIGIERGQTWFPFDQIDWILGLLFGVWTLGSILTWNWWYLLMIPIGLTLHIIIKYIGHQLKLDDKPI